MFKLLIHVIIVLGTNSVYADCDVVSKKAWGGINPSYVEYLAPPIDMVIIQHTGTLTCKSDVTCKALVRNIQVHHKDVLMFWDIAPSFLVGGNGQVYEGSGWLHIGSHTYRHINRRSYAFAFIGDFNRDKPTSQAIEAAKALIRCGKEKGYLRPKTHVKTHSQLTLTESPGEKLSKEIMRWPDWQP